MSTITVRRSDVTSDEVADALRVALGPHYDVVPGMRMPRVPLLAPRPDRAELILVSSSPMVRAQVRIIRHSGMTDIRVIPGGLLFDLLMNRVGIARKIRRALSDAPGMRSSIR